jgi:NADPH-dependent glutamate synthase beta subunit-like oxidoreductase
VAVVGGGPAGLSCAYQLRRRGHSPVVFEANGQLGGMLRYGLSAHRCPRDLVDAEIDRLLETGIEVRVNTRVGVDVTIEALEAEFDAIFWGIGAWSGNPVPVPGWDKAANCVDGLAYLRAYNEGRLQYLTGRTLIIGGGNTAMDCAGVSRRLGQLKGAIDPSGCLRRWWRARWSMPRRRSRHGARRTCGSSIAVRLRRRQPTSTRRTRVIDEGVEIHESLAPVEVILGADGRARALKVIKTDWSTGKMVTKPGSEFEIECDLIVAATGQSSIFTGIEALDNGKGLVAADGFYQVKDKAAISWAAMPFIPTFSPPPSATAGRPPKASTSTCNPSTWTSGPRSMSTASILQRIWRPAVGRRRPMITCRPAAPATPISPSTTTPTARTSR